ncbi:uncharacterized protein LOC116425633 isoform X2 [Nomia melanderi]|uniref:uncharacterized protein LOC116425633 isoform X2 n=1 Tax=Nomia melanderi TaxID=2448451 RepID=UPI003FCCBB80
MIQMTQCVCVLMDPPRVWFDITAIGASSAPGFSRQAEKGTRGYARSELLGEQSASCPALRASQQDRARPGHDFLRGKIWMTALRREGSSVEQDKQKVSRSGLACSI